MTAFLLPTPNAQDRKTKAAALSLLTNLLLIGLKVSVGVLTHSVSILSEAVHSAADLLASGLTLASVRVAELPPDTTHPYGHGKAEALSALAEALLLVGASAYIISEAIQKLLAQARPERVDWGIAVMAVSALVNVFVARHMRRVALETESQALLADAENRRADIITALGVLAGLVLVWVTGRGFFDPLLAILVSLMILWTAWRLAQTATATLMDSHLPQEDEDKVRRLLSAEPHLLGYHKLRTRHSGTTRYVDAHIMMDDEMTLLEAHDLTEALEDRIREVFPDVQVTLHTEPYHAEEQHQRETHHRPAQEQAAQAPSAPIPLPSDAEKMP